MSIELLGTSHISPHSASQASTMVYTGDFDLIALELDRMRLHSLLSGNTQQASFWQLIRAVGVWGALLAQIGRYVEHKLGARIGMVPGAEMKAAAMAAAKSQKPIALIDQPIQITLQRFNKAFTWKERWRLLKSAFKRTEFRKFSLDSVPDEETIAVMINAFEKAAPALAKVLIHERNEYMVKRLIKLQEMNPEKKILAIVGAGHVPGMNKLLESQLNKAKQENKQ